MLPFGCVQNTKFFAQRACPEKYTAVRMLEADTSRSTGTIASVGLDLAEKLHAKTLKKTRRKEIFAS
jgi:hypothetical protein